MPDPPQAHKRNPQLAPPASSPVRAPYAELHCKTNFSFLEGASHPDELVQRAAELGYAALAITDRNSLAGVVRAHGAAKQIGLKLLIGAEITLVDAPPVVLWATDRAAYGRLARLITLGRRRAPKGEFLLSFDDLAAHAEGLVAGVVLNCGLRIADCGLKSKSHVPTSSPIRNPQSAIRNFRDLFSDRCYALAALHRGPNDEAALLQWMEISRETGVPLVATGDVHYHRRSRLALADVLTAIRLGCTVVEAGKHLFPNAERHLKGPDEISRQFALAPETLQRTLEIAERCTFSLDELRYEYPEELAPPGETPLAYLTRLTWKGANKRYPDGIPDKVRGLIEHELALIADLRYEAYFLTVFDLVRFARHRDILCQGRGSAANSAVCYCLGVTSVDPAQMDVLFERFMSRERNEAPDIDVDFEHERREEVLQYLYEKYGRDRVGMTAEVITYRPRSAVRDVGKALGLSLDRVDRLAKSLEGYHVEHHLADRCRDAGLSVESDLGRRLIGLVEELVGFPRHLGQHVGGMVMTQGPLCELVPIENAAMEGRTVIEWDKDDLDELGILKVDCLSLGMLTAIHKCFKLVEQEERVRSTERGVRSEDEGQDCKLQNANCKLQNEETSALDAVCVRPDGAPRTTNLLVESPPICNLHFAFCNLHSGEPQRPDHPPPAVSHPPSSIQPLTTHHSPLTLASVPKEDPRVYDMICRADTMGVFQIESRAQMSMLPRLKPRCFYDLVIEVAIVRPGPIQGNMVHPYLRRRAGEEAATYPNEAIREVLHKTLGVPLFQEQAMRLAVVAAGFTPGEADQLRRAMGAWRRPGIIEQFRQKLIDGMLARGLSQEFAQQVFHQIRGFGEYGFPESHAASFALLVYVSAWLKCYYPAAFAAALLNSQPMGFYAPAQLVRNARDHGVEVLPVDVNASGWDCRLEGKREKEKGKSEDGCWMTDAGGRMKKSPVMPTDCDNTLRTQYSVHSTQHSSIKADQLPDASRVPSVIQHPSSVICHPTSDIQHPPSDIQHPPSAHSLSPFSFCLSPSALRLGFRLLVGFSEAHARVIEAARREGPFRSLGDFARRTGLNRTVISRLAEADAFGSLEKSRRSALWHALAQEKQSQSLPLFASVAETDEEDVELPLLAEQEEVVADYRTAGLSLRAHPMQFHRELLDELRVTPAIQLAELPNDRFVRVAGLVLVRQRPGTAKGITFVTLEDETGTINLIIRQQIWERYYRAARTAVALLAHGRLQSKDEVIHVLVSRLEDLSDRLPKLRSTSRDFQ